LDHFGSPFVVDPDYSPQLGEDPVSTGPQGDSLIAFLLRIIKTVPKKKQTKSSAGSVPQIELAEVIWIVAFAHTSRRPHYGVGRTEERQKDAPGKPEKEF
jgi:hypothetical protein